MKKNTKPRKLQIRFLQGMTVTFLTITLVSSLIVSLVIQHEMYKKYGDIAFGSAHTVAELIDGDTIDNYLEIKERDDYYMEIRSEMDMIADNFDLMYLFVCVPHEDHLTYVWAADDEDVNIIGDDDVYSNGGKEVAYLAFSKEPEYKLINDKDEEYGRFMSACVPIYDSSGEPVALAFSDVSTGKIRTTILTAILNILIVNTVVMVIVVILYYMYIKSRLIQPILYLNDVANDMVNRIDTGEAIKINIHTGDEIEALARSFEKLHLDLTDYIAENTRITAEKERIGAELNVATQIQADMLPSIFPPFPDRSEFDLFASMDPAKEVGGDFYDFFLIDDDHLALVLADVSGKGVPAALFMVIAKTLIKNHAQIGEYSPAKVLMQANEQLCEGNEAELFVTVWLAIIEISTGKGLAANAGHEHPALRHAGGEFELVKYRHSPAVATMDGVRFKEHEFQLLPGDTIFVYTDGVPEATNANDELFGEERLLSALNEKPDAMPKELLQNVRRAVDQFVGDAPQFDDLTMLGVTYYGTEEKEHV